MTPRFPLKDVTIGEVPEPRKVEHPVYADSFWQINQDEFAMQVEGVGRFYARDGSEVEYAPVPEASQESLELYLNGSVFGAILHQRQILPLHGSSFVFDGKGILVCGETGAGKSSITASFVLDGAIFLTDDVTPVVMRDGEPNILALSDRMKLWDHTLDQLKLTREGLRKIDATTGKYYVPMVNGLADAFSLDMVFIISINDNSGLQFTETFSAQKILALRNEIYRWEYLQGMKENEAVYFSQLADICKLVRVINISRQFDTEIGTLKRKITDYVSML